MSRSESAVVCLSLTETASFLVLLAMMATGNETGVSIVGMIHGLLFAAYAVVVWLQRADLGWRTRFAALAILTGPIGAIIALERIRRDHRGRGGQPAVARAGDRSRVGSAGERR